MLINENPLESENLNEPFAEILTPKSNQVKEKTSPMQNNIFLDVDMLSSEKKEEKEQA